jgi:hypothetical protein
MELGLSMKLGHETWIDMKGKCKRDVLRLLRILLDAVEKRITDLFSAFVWVSSFSDRFCPCGQRRRVWDCNTPYS